LLREIAGLYLRYPRRVIQSSAAERYAIVDGMNARDSRVHNYPPRWNAAPSHDLLVIRRNHQTGEITLGSVVSPGHLSKKKDLSCLFTECVRS
jgi:hypothetical protein